MTPLFLESFELYQPREDYTFGDYLRECGYQVTGEPVFTPDRTSYAAAANLSNGSLTYPVTSLNPNIAFGFAARVSEDAPVWQLHDSLVLTLGSVPRVNGVMGPNPTPYDQWLYYEISLDKIARTMTLYINGQRQQDFPLPSALRFLTEFEPTFFSTPDLAVDDLYVSEDGRMGPIAVRAHPTTADVPVTLDTKGQSSTGYAMVSETLDNVVAVGVKSKVQITDLDARKTVFIAGSQERDIVPGTSNEYRGGLFAKATGGRPWTADTINDTAFGVKIAR